MYYINARDSGHQETGLDDNHCELCQDNYQVNDIDSLKYPIYSLWFHEKYYCQLWFESQIMVWESVTITTSRMELFVIKFNDFQSLTNATKNFIFNVTELVLGILIDINTFFLLLFKRFSRYSYFRLFFSLGQNADVAAP